LTELPRKLEIKARDADPRRSLEAALALGAQDHGELAQRDTYSPAPAAASSCASRSPANPSGELARRR
jgi:hypothetical protein